MNIQDAGDTTIPFGQYKSKTLFTILDSDPSYIHWLFTIDTKNKLKEALDMLCKNSEVQRLLEAGYYVRNEQGEEFYIDAAEFQEKYIQIEKKS